MKNKNAFTFAELLIAMVIIGIVLIVVFTLFSPTKELNRQKLVYKYAAAYRALDIFASNFNDDINPFGGIYKDKSITNKPYEALCFAMEEYFNTKGSANCTDEAKLNNDTLLAVDENTDFSTLTPSIRTLNGMNIYIGDMFNYERDNGTADPNDDIKFKFFMVYVDINAKNGGNHNIKYDFPKDEYPDVFAFAIVPTGNVIPIGVAEYNRMILPVRIGYIEDHRIHYTNSYSYREAKHKAWGFYDSTNDGKEYKDNIPYTYNDYIREYLVGKGSKLYDGLDNITYSDKLLDKCTNKYSDCSLRISLPKYMK